MTNRVRVAAMTHRGAVRERNEDALVVGGFLATEVTFSDPVVWQVDTVDPVVVAVADGLGGYRGGELASAHAARRLAVAGPDLSDEDQIRRTLIDISDEIEALAAAPGLTGMGTTVAGLVISSTSSTWFSVGDSRVHQENGGYLGQLSIDDSPVAELTDGSTAVTNQVTQYLGGPAADGRIHPHIGVVEQSAPHRWLVCTDGLTDLVEVAEIERLLRAEDDDTRVVKALWVAAMNRSGRDNISILLVSAGY